MNIEENSGDKTSRKEKRERTKSRIEGDQVGFSEVTDPRENHLCFDQVEAARGGRKSSYMFPGDYDSELVDGKYVTSVPIISVEDADEKEGNIRWEIDEEENIDEEGSIDSDLISRPGHSLKDLKKPVTRKNSLIERLSRTGSARDVTEPPRRYHLSSYPNFKEPSFTAENMLIPLQCRSSGSNVFDRLSNGRSTSRTNLASESTRASNTSLAKASVTSSRATR